MFKVDNRDTRKRCEICSKLTIKTLERRHSVSIVNFELVNAWWEGLRNNYTGKITALRPPEPLIFIEIMTIVLLGDYFNLFPDSQSGRIDLVVAQKISENYVVPEIF